MAASDAEDQTESETERPAERPKTLAEEDRGLERVLDLAARETGKRKSEVARLLMRKLKRVPEVRSMDDEDLDRMAERLRRSAGVEKKEPSVIERMSEMEYMDQMEARRKSRERREQEEQGGGGGMGFKPREMMDMMMMQTMMQRMGGGGSDLAEIMKWKAIMGNGNDGDLDKVIQVLREEANAQRERQDQMMAQMYGEKKAEEFRRFQEGMLAKQAERDQIWEEKLAEKDEANRKLAEALANQGKKPEGGRIVDGVSLADGPRLKKELEEVGVLKPATVEEREQRKLEMEQARAESAASRSAEVNREILEVVNQRVGALEASFDRKLDKVLGIFMNEQAARMQAAGVKVPVQEVSEAEKRQTYERLQRQVRAQEQEQQGANEGEAQGS